MHSKQDQLKTTTLSDYFSDQRNGILREEGYLQETNLLQTISQFILSKEMDFTSIDLQQVVCAWDEIENVPCAELVPIVYQGQPLSLALPSETVIKIKIWCRKTNQIVYREDGLCYSHPVTENTGKQVAVCYPPKGFCQFLQKLYLVLAKDLQARDERHDMFKAWKHAPGTPSYAGFEQFWKWEDNQLIISFPLGEGGKLPTGFCMEKLRLSKGTCKVACRQ